MSIFCSKHPIGSAENHPPKNGELGVDHGLKDFRNMSRVLASREFTRNTSRKPSLETPLLLGFVGQA